MDQSTSRAAGPAPSGPRLAAERDGPPSTTMSRGVRFTGLGDMRFGRQCAFWVFRWSWTKPRLHESYRRVSPKIFGVGRNHYCWFSEPCCGSFAPRGAVLIAYSLAFATISPKAFPPGTAFEPVPWTLGFYALFTAARLALAYRGRLRGGFIALSVVVDMAVLMIAISSEPARSRWSLPQGLRCSGPMRQQTGGNLPFRPGEPL